MPSRLSKTVQLDLYLMGQLPLAHRALIEGAIKVRNNAQAPYSHYFVGAAALSESGKIYTGCNVENVNWTATTHAEQNAIASMIAAEGPVKLEAIAIVGAPEGATPNVARDSNKRPANVEVGNLNPSCGHCLQIEWENCLGDPDVPLFFLTPWGEIGITTIGDAYPMPFGPEALGINIKKRG